MTRFLVPLLLAASLASPTLAQDAARPAGAVTPQEITAGADAAVTAVTTATSQLRGELSALMAIAGREMKAREELAAKLAAMTKERDELAAKLKPAADAPADAPADKQTDKQTNKAGGPR